MTRRRQHGTPLVVMSGEPGGRVARLERLPREIPDEAGTRYDERWLQHLIHAHPEILPVIEIEPAFEPAIPVCIELQIPGGNSIDNFFITPTGNLLFAKCKLLFAECKLLFAECKLWRNPEARRQVVAQVMNYIENITSWGYRDLEKAVRSAKLPGGEPLQQLYDLLGEDQELDEPAFIDAVSRNLRLGRGLFFIVGDGIREEAESLTAHLQAHAGLHFVLALVELALFRLPSDGVLVQPRIIARTTNIERGIIRFEDARISVKPVPVEGRDAQRGKTLSEEEFYEQMARRDPGLPDRLRAFIERLEPVGVAPEFKKSLILRWRAPDGTKRNVGYIKTDGSTWTDAVNWGGSQLGILDITHEYVRELAEAIGGEVKVSPTNSDYRYAALKGHASRIEQILKHEDAWVRAIERLSERVTERLEARSE